MSTEINAYMLKKEELEYEVIIRGGKPATNVKDLRSQVARLFKDPSPTSLPSDFDLAGELSVLKSKTDSLCEKLATPSEYKKQAQIDRLRSLAFHLQHRTSRVPLDLVDGELLSKIQSNLAIAMSKLECEPADTDMDSDSASDSESEEEPSKHCYHKITYVHPTAISSLNLKYNGKTCVLSFLGRLDELVRSRSLNYRKVFRSAAELFTDSALLWYRGICSSVDSWEDLKQELLDEFLPTDFDYRLMEELKARTQGIDESFSSYYSVMLNFFARLRTPISDEEKLRILRRNIRPSFSERLALVPIVSLSDFKSKCKELETQKLNSQFFVEPPKQSQQTLASDLAYKCTVRPAVAAVSAEPQKSRSNLFCYRCRVNGHSLRNCTVDKSVLVCFSCGEKGYTVYSCPKCNNKPTAVNNHKRTDNTNTCCHCQAKSSSSSNGNDTSKNL